MILGVKISTCAFGRHIIQLYYNSIIKPFLIFFIVLTSLQNNFWGSEQALVLDWWKNWNPERRNEARSHRASQSPGLTFLKHCHLSSLYTSVVTITPHSIQLPTLYSTFHFKCFLSTLVIFLINSDSWLLFSLLLIFFSIRCTCSLPTLTRIKF